jgi:predicted metal-dependent HD superfamily phosphohydrolase
MTRISRNLILRYSEPHRHYHTWQHIEECLAWYDRLHSYLENPDDVFVAIHYHDAVYDPMRTDNEFQSMKLAEEDGQSSRVVDLIACTDHRNGWPIDMDEKYLHDIDMSILGAQPYRYQEYSRQIRAEYFHVPQAEYAKGRSEFLHGVLENSRTFITPFFSSLECWAEQNIMWELEMLEG